MIVLPWPPSILSGHAGGHWRPKAAATAKHREWARLATLAALPACFRPTREGDIAVNVRFVPPDRRSDRTNYAIRLKPYFDGLADALGVNDRRFVPAYTYAEPEKPGRVEIEIEAAMPSRPAEKPISARYLTDPSAPDAADHDRHIRHIARANGGMGFPVCNPPRIKP